jgi:hypothetical protein
VASAKGNERGGEGAALRLDPVVVGHHRFDQFDPTGSESGSGSDVAEMTDPASPASP